MATLAELQRSYVEMEKLFGLWLEELSSISHSVVTLELWLDTFRFAKLCS